MENSKDSGNQDVKKTGFRSFAVKRIVLGTLLAVALLWIITTVLGVLGPGKEDQTLGIRPLSPSPVSLAPGPVSTPLPAERTGRQTAAASGSTTVLPSAASGALQLPKSEALTVAPKTQTEAKSVVKSRGKSTYNPSDTDVSVTMPSGQVRGQAFVLAMIGPLSYELNDRFWGWRPNDIFNFTDDVNNFQLGVLECTRRGVVALEDRLSRTGATATLDPNLENAANSLMVTASRYWFPSPESKYRECIGELKVYLEKLKRGEASFYTRPDNLIPLLASYEDLMGSCDENLVKQVEENGKPVSFFSSDDYFFYAKGVASAMKVALEAIEEDFSKTLENRHATEILHHAIASCQRAMEIDPWIILDSDLSSVFANHRANMAAPIGHARYYLELLIRALSV
jgi:hypothetical protein